MWSPKLQIRRRLASLQQGLRIVLYFATCRDPSKHPEIGASAEAPVIKHTDSSGQQQEQEQVVTPWDVQGSVSADGQQLAINYDKLIQQFGTKSIDQALLDRFEKLTGHNPHPLLRRGMFFSHR
jgi:tryptophanyl-tRNA synthetase